MPVIGRGAPEMRSKIGVTGWQMRARRRAREASDSAYRPLGGSEKIEFDADGSILIPGTPYKIVRGVALVGALDVDNCNLNGWFFQPRATTKAEMDAGMVRVSKL